MRTLVNMRQTTPNVGNAMIALGYEWDSNYNPKAYPNNEPPAARAHGAHRATWTGHSRFGVNVWWAVENVPEEASMIFYPGMSVGA